MAPSISFVCLHNNRDFYWHQFRLIFCECQAVRKRAFCLSEIDEEQAGKEVLFSVPYLAIMIFMLPAGCVRCFRFHFTRTPDFLSSRRDESSYRKADRAERPMGTQTRPRPLKICRQSPIGEMQKERCANRNRSYSLCVCVECESEWVHARQKAACLSLALPRTQHTHTHDWNRSDCGLGATFLLRCFFYAIFL
jgi:hypothetical protein